MEPWTEGSRRLATSWVVLQFSWNLFLANKDFYRKSKCFWADRFRALHVQMPPLSDTWAVKNFENPQTWKPQRTYPQRDLLVTGSQAGCTAMWEEREITYTPNQFKKKKNHLGPCLIYHHCNVCHIHLMSSKYANKRNNMLQVWILTKQESGVIFKLLTRFI